MSKNTRILLFIMRNGSWRIRAVVAVVALGICVVDPLAHALDRAAARVLRFTAWVNTRLRERHAEEVTALARIYRAQEAE